MGNRIAHLADLLSPTDMGVLACTTLLLESVQVDVTALAERFCLGPKRESNDSADE